MKLTVFDKAKKKTVTVGTVKDDVFYRQVWPRHFMVKEHGYGIQTEILDSLIRLKVQTICLEAKRCFLESHIVVWVEHGVVKNYRHGKQTFLDIKYMKRRNK